MSMIYRICTVYKEILIIIILIVIIIFKTRGKSNEYLDVMDWILLRVIIFVHNFFYILHCDRDCAVLHFFHAFNFKCKLNIKILITQHFL